MSSTCATMLFMFFVFCVKLDIDVISSVDAFHCVVMSSRSNYEKVINNTNINTICYLGYYVFVSNLKLR
jgi:hypothetical protein